MRILLAFLMLAASSGAQAGDDYRQALQAQARARGLDADPYWQRLLHYRSNWALGGRSTVDTPGFFLAPSGKSDPAAELDATLAAFFGSERRLDEPLQCRFKARYEWLKAQLQFDPARLPSQPCPLFEEWRGTLDAAGIRVVFAANDLNGPATMYGHTLMRVDAQRNGPDQGLLSTAVNYAAVVNRGSRFAYMLQGVSGGFVGEFSIKPYYEKVRQYGRINHRDLWEYPLRLAPDEVDRLMWHLWEMRAVGSQYYFFTENCSYMLLTLIDTARPGLALGGQFDGPIPYTIPSDTLRVLRQAELAAEPDFRPSLARRLQHQLGQLDVPERQWVLAYGRDRADLDDARYTTAPERQRARMLETANDFVYYRLHEDELPRARAQSRSLALLRERSRVQAGSEFSEVPRPTIPPDRGHDTARATLGVRTDRHEAATLLRARAAYHDLLDPPAGYLLGGELEFFELAVLSSAGRTTVAEFELVNVHAISAWDDAFRNWSWQVAGGARRYGLQALAARPEQALGGYVTGAGGIAAEPWRDWLTYAFAVAELDLNRDLDRGYAAAAGARLGAVAYPLPRLSQQLEVETLYDVAGGGERQWRAELGWQWQLAAPHGLRLSAEWRRLGEASERALELQWQYYF